MVLNLNYKSFYLKLQMATEAIRKENIIDMADGSDMIA